MTDKSEFWILSNAIYTDIILVIEAGGIFSFEFFSNKISLVSKSTTIACLAFVSIEKTLKEKNKEKNKKIIVILYILNFINSKYDNSLVISK